RPQRWGRLLVLGMTVALVATLSTRARGEDTDSGSVFGTLGGAPATQTDSGQPPAEQLSADAASNPDRNSQGGRVHRLLRADPSEYSSGVSTRGTSPSLATPTCAPSWSVSDWADQHRPGVGLGLCELRERQRGLDPAVAARAWAAQLRWCGRFRRLAARKTSRPPRVAALRRSSLEMPEGDRPSRRAISRTP